MDEKDHFNNEQVSLLSDKGAMAAAQGRRRPSLAQKRVRWADEERLHTPLVLAVVMLNALFLLLGLLGRWGFFGTDANTQVPVPPPPPRLEHEIRDVVATAFPTMMVPPAGPHAVRHWIEVTRRQTAPPPPGNASALPIQTFQVDVPLLGLDGKVVGAGTPDGFSGVGTTVNRGAAGAAGCEVTLGVNVFNNSFGMPFVGNYTPPACLGDSNTVVVNLTVKARGRQFDRLAIV